MDPSAYFLLVDGEQSGPYSVQQLRTMVREGQLDDSAHVWKEGLENWLPVRSVPELVGTDAGSGEPAGDDAPALTVGEKLRTSAKLTAVQAKLGKLRRIDLRMALRDLGKAAYDKGYRAPELDEPYEAVATILDRIRSVRASKPETEGATALERAKHVAGKGKQAIEIETLGHRRDNAYIAIGEIIADGEETPGIPGDELREVMRIRADIDVLEREIGSLQSRVSGLFARPGRMLALIALVLALLGVRGWVVPYYQSWKVQRDTERRQELADAEIRRIEAEMQADARRLELESLALRNRMEEEARAETARLERERLALELQEKEEELAKELAEKRAGEQRELERRQADLKRAAAAAERERVKAEEMLKAREDAEKAQMERQKLAADLLSNIPLAPEITLSGKLRNSGASVEMRGEKIEELTRLRRAKDWLGMLGLLGVTVREEYPDANSIERGATRLKSSTFGILLRTRFQEARTSQLFAVVFPGNSDHHIMRPAGRWERHPDGIGYLLDWRPEDGPVVVVAGTYGAVGSHIYKASESYTDELRNLKRKKSLGELSDDAYGASVEALRKKAWREISRWAAGV